MAVQLEPVELDVESAIQSIDDLKQHIEEAFEAHGDSEDPRVIKTLQGLKQIYAELNNIGDRFNHALFDTKDTNFEINEVKERIRDLKRAIDEVENRAIDIKVKAFTPEIENIGKQLAEAFKVDPNYILNMWKISASEIQELAKSYTGENAEKVQQMADTYSNALSKFEPQMDNWRYFNSMLEEWETRLENVQAVENYNKSFQKLSENAQILGARLKTLTEPKIKPSEIGRAHV